MSADKNDIARCICGHVGTLEQLADHKCPPPPPTIEQLAEKMDRIETKIDCIGRKLFTGWDADFYPDGESDDF